MVSAKRLAQMAKKWQRLAALGRKRLARTTSTAKRATDECYCYTTSSAAVKGHFVVYTTDGVRFEVPLPYLSTVIFAELLRMSHEEFGFASDRRITLPCDAAVMEYVFRLLRRNTSPEVERAFLSSMVETCHYGSGLETSTGFSQLINCF